MGNMLIEDWKSAYKWLSVQMAALLGVFTVLYDQLTMLQAVLTPQVFHGIQVAAVVGVVAGRVINQAPKAVEEKKE